MDWEGEGKVMPDFDKLEGQQRAGSQQAGDLPQWAARQQKVFTNWINNKVADRQLTVIDLFVDLQDGTVLYGLLEVLSKQSLAFLGRVKPEKNKIKKIANMNIVWKFLSSTVRMVGIGPTDIVDGNVTLTLGMIWSLIVFFLAKDLGDSGDGLSALKKRIMEWMTKRTRHYPDVQVKDFTDSLANGKAFLAILDDFDPSDCPYKPTASASTNLNRAFDDFHRLFGVGAILDADDPQCCADEKANITYLAELMKAMPVLQEDEEDEEERARRRRRAIVDKDPRKAALIHVEEIFPSVVDKLGELCAYGPTEGKGCANKVAELMERAGLISVKVVVPSGPREDPSMRGNPFVVGEKEGPSGSPTVLFYASYGTVDESDWESKETGVLHGDAGDDINKAVVCEKWASDPLTLSPVPGTSKTGPGARLSARGVAQDKANVVCQLAAIEALVNGPTMTLPCGVKVVVGGTPPPAAMVGNGQLDVADRLTDFLKAHPSITGRPDLVVVSEPGGASLAPGKSAVLIGCRGFAAMEMSVSTFDDKQAASSRGCADYGGPLIDPGRVLASVLASLHDPHTGALKVDGLCCAPDKNMRQGLKDLMRYGEHHIRPETGYLSQVACAKEVYLQGGQPIPASVMDQLTLIPSTTVTSLSMPPSSIGGGSDAGLLGSAFPSKATAGIHLCLPPGGEYLPGVQAFQAHCARHTPYGATMRFDKVEGRAGWLTPPGVPYVDALLASRTASAQEVDDDPHKDDGRDVVLASNPGFSAIPSAFARALPSSAVVGLGVNDTKAKAAAPNESVLVDDLKAFVSGTVRLVHGLSKPVAGISGTRASWSGSLGGRDGLEIRSSSPSVSRSNSRPGSTSTSPKQSGVAYAHRFIDDLDRRNAVNQLRGKRSNGPSPAGSVSNSPRGAPPSRLPFANSPKNTSPVSSPTSPLFSHVERDVKKVSSSHPLSPARPARNLSAPPGSPPPHSTSSTSLQSQPSPLTSTLASLALSDPPGETPAAAGSGGGGPLPPAPSAAMAALAAAALGQGGMGMGGAGGVGGGLAGMLGGGPGATLGAEDDDDKVGGGTPETILAEINELRTNPRGYTAKLEGLIQHYDNSLYQSPTGPPVQTTEGSKPLLEAIEMLKTTKPLGPMESKEGMQQAASDHAKDLAETSRTGHSGSDGSKAADRMNRYGQFFQVAGEVCTYFDATPEGIVAQLLVSDGERSRHNRKALLAPHFKCAGVALCTHPTVGAACVITLAGGYGPRPLTREADVCCYGGEKPTAEFREVLESVPVPQITDEVKKCLNAGMEVQLKYAPGEIKCTFVQSTGARKSMGCKWA